MKNKELLKVISWTLFIVLINTLISFGIYFLLRYTLFHHGVISNSSITIILIVSIILSIIINSLITFIWFVLLSRKYHI